MADGKLKDNLSCNLVLQLLLLLFISLNSLTTMVYSVIILALLIFTISTKGVCQSDIYGRISDVDSNGIAYANVLLLNGLDSVLVKGAVADESGHFVFADIARGTYRIECSRVGYSKFYSPSIMISDGGKVTLRPIILFLNELEEVTVKATRPLYEMEMGKMVINVQSSITSAGLSVMDVLERSPGIMVNRQNNSFSLGGKEGVVVLMNGKRSRMPMEALYQMLSGLNAGNVEKIEIMTIPPARYDSDGDAGFINLVMQRSSETVGTHARLTAGLSHGTDPHGNLSLNLNHQGDKLNWFANYSFNAIVQDQEWESYRESSNERESLSTTNNADRNVERIAHNYQAGFDYSVSEQLVLGGLISGYSSLFKLDAPTVASFDYSMSPDTLISLTMNERNQWEHKMGNVNFRYSFKNQVFNANLDYLTYNNMAPSGYSNSYYSGSGLFIRDEENRIAKNTPIKIWVAKVDHSLLIGKSSILESGIKGTFSDLINEVSYETKLGDSWVGNPTLSNYSVLIEDILAVFSSIKIEPDSNTVINAGIRYEHTLTNLETVEDGRVVDRNYGEFFPSLFLSRKINQNHGVQFSYGRRITRPTFNQMAPYVIFLDPYTFFAGNVNIIPTFTHTIKSDYSFKSLMFSLQYSYDKDLILRHQPHMTSGSNTLVFISDNVDRRNTIAASVSFPFKVMEWWELQNNLTVNMQSVDSELNGEVYQAKQNGFQFNMTQTFMLPKDYVLELAGNYTSRVINGYFNWTPTGFVNLGLQKEFNYGGILRVSCTDIFETHQLRWKSYDNTNIYIKGRMKFDSRTFALTYTHEFGNRKIKGTRNRSVGSQEEQKRVTN